MGASANKYRARSDRVFSSLKAGAHCGLMLTVAEKNTQEEPMHNTRWNDTSDHSARNAAHFDGRADCINWLAERLDESAQMIARDQYSPSSQSCDDALAAAETGRSAPVAARAWLAAALAAAGLLIVHLLVG
jgi:hypothetical protein